MGGRELDDDWKGWLRENIGRGCDPHELLGILLDHSFGVESIAACMGAHFPAGSPRLATTQRGTADYVALTEVPPKFLAQQRGLWRLPSDQAQLFTLDGFLSAAECARLVGLIKT